MKISFLRVNSQSHLLIRRERKGGGTGPRILELFGEAFILKDGH